MSIETDGRWVQRPGVGGSRGEGAMRTPGPDEQAKPGRGS
jgi:hypothetical protein